MMDNKNIDQVVRILGREYKKHRTPVVTMIALTKGDPFKVLISCLLSLRTKDEVTAHAVQRLFSVADSPQEISRLSKKRIEKLIYPVGFYKTKAGNMRRICKELCDNYECRVPDEIDELLKFKGVGRKTANLVVALGYGKEGICVDTHVHRISNRLGYIKTKNPEATEFALRAKLPKKHWKHYNDYLVSFGQHTCVPVSPWCSRCPIRKFCPRMGVAKSR
ncbi:endonuclease III [Candidatus Woesearchaeota archaeon]|nr:endonuclease III [Candidatus Woesearchaeota archaeon]